MPLLPGHVLVAFQRADRRVSNTGASGLDGPLARGRAVRTARSPRLSTPQTPRTKHPASGGGSLNFSSGIARGVSG